MSNLPFTDDQLEQLKSFVDLYNKQPTIINHPKLEFFKTFLQRLGARLPRIEKDDDDTTESFDKESNCEPEPESEESDLELDMTGVIEPDNDAPQQMGDYDLQPTDEQMEQSQEKRSEAVSAFMETDYEKAIQLYTEAILLNPQASLLYAKRGQVYILLKKPNACIRDCDRAIELNPDSAAAHKFRGRANQLLGKWEEAANDLRKACKYDFDEQADEWLREVTPNARKIEEHKRKKERKALERQEREKRERVKRMREAQAKAREESAKQQHSSSSSAGAGGFPGAGGAGAGAGAGAGMGNFAQFMNDPEILMAFQDPDVAEAFKDISSNPGNMFKYQSNPKIMAIITKMATKFGGAGGMPGMGGMGGMPGMGGMGGMPNFGGGAAPTSQSSGPACNEPDEFGLD